MSYLYCCFGAPSLNNCNKLRQTGYELVITDKQLVWYKHDMRVDTGHFYHNKPNATQSTCFVVVLCALSNKTILTTKSSFHGGHHYAVLELYLPYLAGLK